MPAIRNNSRSRNWVFTLNNYTGDEVEFIHSAELGDLRCIAYAKERGESGTPHLQGFVCFSNKKSLRQVKAVICNRAHIEMMRGSIDNSVDYCSKDGDLVIIGKVPMSKKEQGAKGAEVYKEAWELAKKGRIEDIDPSLRLRYYPTLKRIEKDFMVRPDSLSLLSNEWVFGSTGVGKSRHTRERFQDAYYKPCNKWWDGYQGEETVIIEDFDADHRVLGHHLKIWGDHGAFVAECKGGSMCIRPKRIIITSNYAPKEIWDNEKTWGPICRRFKLVEYDEAKGRELKARWDLEAMEAGLDAAIARVENVLEEDVNVLIPRVNFNDSLLDLTI